MKAVILVGGEGTRLRPLTCNIHKAMVPILNKPFLEHMLHYLRGYGVDDIILTLCHLPEHIKDYFADGSKFEVKLSYVIEESPLGTAGAVKNAETHLDDLFFVFNGDIFTDIDLQAMLSFHRERKATATIALTPVEDPTLYGVVETDLQGRVKRFVEKPSWEEVTTNLINAGIYILDREILQDIPTNTPFMFERHLFPGLLAKGVPIYGFPSHAYWIDIGTPEKYLQLHHELLQEKSTAALCSQIRDKEISPKALIHPTAEIEGSVIIGSGCSIGPGVRIKGPAVIGEGSKILNHATIERTVLWRNVQVGKQVTLKDCIVGDNSFIGDGSFIAQGSVIGDNVIINQGGHLSPGTKIWPDTRI
jgi:mannose-1-phosphate guanylyltransferase